MLKKSCTETRTSLLAILCIGLAGIGGGLTSGASRAYAAEPAGSADRSMAQMLQSMDHEFDRESLEPGIAFMKNGDDLEAGIRCASRPVGDFEQQFIGAAVEERLAAIGTAHRSKMFEIPVHFHIMRQRSGAWNVTDSQIAEQLDILNNSFVQHGFTFTLDGVSRRNKNRFAKKCLKKSVEKQFKKKYAVDPSTTLNIYSCRPKKDVLGYATFPSDYPEDDSLHGVVLLHSSFPGGSAFPYDQGDTAVHEVGHYLGLYHTFQGRCGKKGDRISDTPREKTPASGCAIGRDTCMNYPGLDPVTNFMDYSDDSCVEEFTPEQELRMKDRVATFRPSLGGH